jgi:glycosyltransferase involved in cell wall biosynthesis
MEPYSPSALFVFLLARIFLSRSTQILFYSLQNIYKEFPLPLRLIQNFIFKRSSHILALSEEVSGVLRKQGFRGELIRFPLWADSSLFFLDSSKAERHTRSENSPRVWVGFCGAVTESKGVVDLLDALELFTEQELSAIHFEIAGGGPCLELARDRLAALGRKGLSFTLHGPLPATALPEFFNTIDVLVVPSRTEKHWKEQFGRVIVEAWACGATVIGSNSGEIPVLLAQPELIFEERNPSALFQKLRNALSFEHNSDLRRKNAMRAHPFLDVSLARRFADELLRIQLDEVQKR